MTSEIQYKATTLLDIKSELGDITQVIKFARGRFVGLLSKRECKGLVVREHTERPALKRGMEVFYSEVGGEQFWGWGWGR